MKELLEYIFGTSQLEAEAEETKSAIEKIMEEAEEQEPLKVKRTPLVSALKALGIKDVSDQIQYDPEGFALVSQDETEYREHVRLLMEPEAMEKLATLGWVVTRCGDVAMSNEPAEFRIRFLEIATTDGSTKTDWPAPNPKLVTDIIKKGREFMSEPGPHDPDGPVEYDDKTSDDNQKGVGKEQDGKDPEGKPKGSTGKTESRSWKLEGSHKSSCSCGFCKNKGRFGKKKDEPNASKDEPKKEPDASKDEPKYGMNIGMKDSVEPPRYDDMFQMISERKQKTQQVKKAYKIRRRI